jgi:hypothetical protein
MSGAVAAASCSEPSAVRTAAALPERLEPLSASRTTRCTVSASRSRRIGFST